MRTLTKLALIVALGGPAQASNQFTYLPVPTVASINPTSGPAAGGTLVTITGTGFAAGATVAFDGANSPTVTFVSATQITAVSPPGTGTVAVTITTAGGTSP